MYQERFIKHQGQTLFNIERINNKSSLIVFFHGIGDSHLNFNCFFNAKQLENYDLFIADLLGYGKSSSNAKDYSFSTQIEALAAQLSEHIKNYQQIIFVPHSMSGIHSTLLARDHFAGKINGIYAIETSITQFGSFIASQVTEITKAGKVFHDWFKDFNDKVYTNMRINNAILRKYYAGLQFASEDAFFHNAEEMYNLSVALKQLKFTSQSGAEFAALPIPKVYCLGDKGAQLQSIPFLLQNNINIERFPTDCHWVAQTCLEDFCNRLDNFIKTLK